ncbi:hypothetical protein C1646_667349 [Rhizophagus diaphanus]|nr:hypothetical protein C1646_667349 [Rhizophagus diaphanus] [Rhizophagus sp. MUCL 43196]
MAHYNIPGSYPGFLISTARHNQTKKSMAGLDIYDCREAQQKEIKKVSYQRFESPPLFSLRVIQAAESHDVIQRYMTLNNDFTKRVKEENRETDTKNINEKRVTKSLMFRHPIDLILFCVNIVIDYDVILYNTNKGTELKKK